MLPCDSTSQHKPLKTPLLEGKHLRFGYNGRVVLDRVSLLIEEGAFVGVIGPNGSGKSTLIKLLSGLLKPWEGVVTFNGRDMAALSRKVVARELAVVSQEDVPDFGFTVGEEIMQGRAPHHGGLYFETCSDWAVVEKSMAQTRVTHLVDRLMESLSGGERQRVRIARGLAQEPRVLLLDEPTNHLDLYSQLSLMELLRDINREGIAILVVSHDINLVAHTCDHVKILYQGTFRAQGTPLEVITPENLAKSFHIEALVDLNPATGSPRMTPVRRLVEDEHW